MELIRTNNGVSYYCKHHNSVTLYYNIVNLNFSTTSLTSFLEELINLNSQLIDESDHCTILLNEQTCRLHLSKTELADLHYLVEGSLCAIEMMEMVSSE